eukprot:TRINITY_DN17910_c0_g1_i1.p1 TRINITY_DN17910_c0_g1~~TRINITY_DN17910_c0_g1_i1.p1  ORF type:complete len:493 (+),score=107.91 TRINITY_DN17910_c0_g1_i1:44-1522(+)
MSVITPATCPSHHGPNARCLKCMGSGATPPPAVPSVSPPPHCTHGPSVHCPRCSAGMASKPAGTAARGRVPWLCTHGPGVKCVNCLAAASPSPSPSPTPAAAATAAGAAATSTTPQQRKQQRRQPCRHPSNMRCPNCMVPTPGEIDETEMCQHGPHGACAHCMPKDAPSAAPPVFRCRNHGPHGSCIECMSRLDQAKLRIKSQTDSHCVRARMDLASANAFQAFVQGQKFNTRRVGFLYGTFDDAGSTTVHAIYEPPQKANKTDFELLPDRGGETADAIATLFGLRRVGWIFSHAARPQILTATEVSMAAAFQAQYDPRFVTVVLSALSPEEQSAKGAGQTKVEAFQVSDQCVELHHAHQIVLPCSNPDAITVRNSVYVTAAETNTIDAHLLMLNIPMVSHQQSIFALCNFPIENRPGYEQKLSDLKVHLMREAARPFTDRLADFHLLLYLVNQGLFSISTDMPPLCDLVRRKVRDRSQIEGFEMLLSGLVG